MENNEIKECLMKIKEYCRNTECGNCKIDKWCRKILKEPGVWPNFEPEWQVVEYDINEKGYYRLDQGGPIPHFDYVQGLQVLMANYNLDPKDVSFGGWFYTESCSWHKSPVLKAEVPCKIRFNIRK